MGESLHTASAATTLPDPALPATALGQAEQKGAFLAELNRDQVCLNSQPPAESARASATPPKQDLPVDSPLQQHPAVEQRVAARLEVTTAPGRMEAFVPGKYYSSYSAEGAGDLISTDVVRALAQSIAEELKGKETATMVVDIAGLASFEGIREKNDALAMIRAQRMQTALQEELKRIGVAEDRVRYDLSGQTAERSADDASVLARLCKERNSSEEQLIRDYNRGAQGFSAEQVKTLDDILAAKRGAKVSTRLEIPGQEKSAGESQKLARSSNAGAGSTQGREDQGATANTDVGVSVKPVLGSIGLADEGLSQQRSGLMASIWNWFSRHSN